MPGSVDRVINLVDPSAFSAIAPSYLAYTSTCRNCAVMVSGANNWTSQSVDSGSHYYVCESQ